MENKSLLMTIAILLIVINSGIAQMKSTLTDSRDGKKYKTVKISTQTWMAENLAYKAISGCWVYDNNQNNLAAYGYLYDWQTAIKVCPSGWHLPSSNDWNKLIVFLGEDRAGEKMIETGTSHWAIPNAGATNSSGFTALASGYRDGSGRFGDLKINAYFWSSSISDASYAIDRSILGRSQRVVEGSSNKTTGYSVRCLKD